MCLGDVMLLQVGEPLVSVPAASVAMLAWAGLAAALLAVAGAYWTRSFPPLVVAGFAVFAVLLRLVPPPLLAPLNDMTTFDILAGVLILVGSLWLIADGGRRNPLDLRRRLRVLHG